MQKEKIKHSKKDAKTKEGEQFSSDIVIGLEVHAELNTQTKLFCSCSRKSMEDEEPNTRCCPVCLGHPGAKPVLNKKALEYALKLALATKSTIADSLVFSRKCYFYPDLAKNYQISQYEKPLAEKGIIALSSGKKIGLTRIHIEEDPASLVHPAGMANSSYVLIDYNRSGNPLCEIVTEPCLESPEEAREFMKKLISILKYLKIFDTESCIIKADANISIRESGYTRVEIKNISGFKEIERALSYEILRQKKAVKENEEIKQETRSWDSETGITISMRTKETEEDYGYIFEPDLVAIRIRKSLIENIKSEMPELPDEKQEKFISVYKISNDDASVLAAEIELAELYEKVAEKISPGLAAKWLRRELLRVMNYNSISFSELMIDESHLTSLLELVEKKEITDNVAKKILEELIVNPFDVKAYVEKNKLKQISDEGMITEICKNIIENNKKAVEELLAGNEKSLNFLVGQAMRETKGKASPQKTKEILRKLISESNKS